MSDILILVQFHCCRYDNYWAIGKKHLTHFPHYLFHVRDNKNKQRMYWMKGCVLNDVICPVFHQIQCMADTMYGITMEQAKDGYCDTWECNTAWYEHASTYHIELRIKVRDHFQNLLHAKTSHWLGLIDCPVDKLCDTAVFSDLSGWPSGVFPHLVFSWLTMFGTIFKPFSLLPQRLHIDHDFLPCG